MIPILARDNSVSFSASEHGLAYALCTRSLCLVIELERFAGNEAVEEDVPSRHLVDELCVALWQFFVFVRVTARPEPQTDELLVDVLRLLP